MVLNAVVGISVTEKIEDFFTTQCADKRFSVLENNVHW